MLSDQSDHVPVSHVGDTDVRRVLAAGTVIERYLEDSPYPTYLMLGWLGSRPLHVVAADNVDARETIVITVYEPDPLQWAADFARRPAPLPTEQARDVHLAVPVYDCPGLTPIFLPCPI